MNSKDLYAATQQQEETEAAYRWFQEYPSELVYIDEWANRMWDLWDSGTTYTELGYMDKLNKIYPYLTSRQQDLLILLVEGKSQVEAGKILGIGQPCVSAALNGPYIKKYNARHGGLFSAIKNKLVLLEKWEAVGIVPPPGPNNLKKYNGLLVCPKCEKIRPMSSNNYCIGCTAPTAVECVKNKKPVRVSKKTLENIKLYLEMENKELINEK